MYDIAIIGSGIVGSALFRELGRYQLNTVLIEKEHDVARGTSRANSAIVHAGYDPENGSKMAKFNLEGNLMFDCLCSELAVPFIRNGALVLALTGEELEQIKQLLENGKRNGVPGLEILSPERTLTMEPNLTRDLLGALYAPTGGIVGAYELTIALAENGLVNGGKILLDHEVTALERNRDTGCFEITFQNGQKLQARRVVNAAGLFADNIHNMIASPSWMIRPRKGEYFLLDHSEGERVKRTIFRAPSKMGKGVLVSPTVHGNLIVGPNAFDQESRTDTGTTLDGQEEVRRNSLLLCPEINFRNNIRNFAGIRAIPDTHDFIVQESQEVPGLIELAGIKSPGLSSAPAIAHAAVELLAQSGIEMTEKKDFYPYRTQTHFMTLSSDEKAALVADNPAFGRIICRCEGITEGEILEAIHRPLGAQTVDGVKRRVRPGCGRCQGGFCLPKVITILARELGIDETEVRLDSEDSWLLDKRMK